MDGKAMFLFGVLKFIRSFLPRKNKTLNYNENDMMRTESGRERGQGLSPKMPQ